MVSGFFSATAVTLTSQCGCPPQQQCTEGVKRLHWRLITFRTLLHLGPNVITFRTSTPAQFRASQNCDRVENLDTARLG